MNLQLKLQAALLAKSMNIGGFVDDIESLGRADAVVCKMSIDADLESLFKFGCVCFQLVFALVYMTLSESPSHESHLFSPTILLTGRDTQSHGSNLYYTVILF